MATLTVNGTKVEIMLTSEEKLWLSSYRHAAIDLTLVGLESESGSARYLATSPRRVWGGRGNSFLRKEPQS